MLVHERFDTHGFDGMQGARAFYDGTHGLRLIVVTDAFWGEAWLYGAHKRRASVHTAALDRSIVFQYDTSTKGFDIVKNDGWPAEDIDVLKTLFDS